MKRIVPATIFFVALAFAIAGMLKPWTGAVIETWQVENQGFRLRVDARQERCFAVCGVFYVFRSAPAGSDDWREIMTVHHDDPNPIPRDNVRFVNARVGYVFFGPKFAVTTDAGRTWQAWDAWEAKKRLPFDDYKLYPSVVEASIDSTGHGRMRLYSLTDKAVSRPGLRTADYGRSWQLD